MAGLDGVTRYSPKDLTGVVADKEKSVNLYREAFEQGRSLSVHLEHIMTGHQEGKGQSDGLDAYERLLMESDVKTRSFEDEGVWADTYGDFEKRAKGLIPEWIRRVWRSAATGKKVSTRAVYSSDDTAENTLQRPRALAMGARADVQIAPAIPVSELVAMTTPVDSTTYTAFYLTNNAANQRMVRVAEAAEIPTAKLVSSEKSIRLLKYGRALEASYEALRRQRINMIALHIARMAVQSEMDKVGTIIDVLVNGDGASGSTAEVFNLTTLDAAAAAGTLSLKGWLAFKMKFASPYTLTTVLMQEAVALQTALLNTGSANIPLSNAQLGALGTGLTPINRFADSVRYGWTSDAPTLKIVGFDRRFAIERITEIGGNIQEVDRFIKSQTELFTMTEVDGYAVLDHEAAKILDVNA